MFVVINNRTGYEIGKYKSGQMAHMNISVKMGWAHVVYRQATQ